MKKSKILLFLLLFLTAISKATGASAAESGHSFDLVLKDTTTPLYDNAFATTKNGTSLNPQTVHVMAKTKDWFLIQTLKLGPKWIKPISYTLKGTTVINLKKTITLPVSLYKVPFDDAKTTTVLNPQTVTAIEQWIDGEKQVWYRIKVSTRYYWIKQPSVYTSSDIYNLELTKWGINNKGINAAQTTKGFNDALNWAKSHGKKVVVVPAGTYLISKDSYINMVSDMTLYFHPSALIQKETNNYYDYSVIRMAEINNASIIGGNFIGDRITHNYNNGTSNEEGYGISLWGATNITIKDATFKNFTGDGIILLPAETLVANVAASEFTTGAIDSYGKLTADAKKVRTTSKKLTFTNTIFSKRKYFQIYKSNITATTFDVYFYKSDGTFISRQTGKRFRYDDITPPAGATKFSIVLNQATLPTNASISFKAMQWAEKVSIQNNDISFNRRQGISVVGAMDVLMQNNTIHDISGTAPESGIDIEGGGIRTNKRITVKDNMFYNNKVWDLVLYDGDVATVDGNLFLSNGEEQLVMTPYYDHFTVKNNVFAASQQIFRNQGYIVNNTFINSRLIIIDGNNQTVDHIKMYGGSVAADGKNIKFSNFTTKDTWMILTNKKAYSMTLDHFMMTNTNKKAGHSIEIEGEPFKITNVTIDGPPGIRAFIGWVKDGSTYDHLKITNYNGIYGLDLPRGTYTNCVLSSDSTGSGEIDLNKPGNYSFTNCIVNVNYTGIHIANTSAVVKIDKSSLTARKRLYYGDGAIIFIHEAKNTQILNSTFNAVNHKEETISSMIKINETEEGRYHPTDVGTIAVKNNIFKASVPIKAVSTIDAGIGAPSIEISGNTLYKAVLQLRSIDKNINNIFYK